MKGRREWWLVAFEKDPDQLALISSSDCYGGIRVIEFEAYSHLLSQLKAACETLRTLGNRTERVETYCPGSHTDYSSMHYNADTTCDICGKSNDSRGGNITSYEPTNDAKLAREALAKLTEAVPSIKGEE